MIRMLLFLLLILLFSAYTPNDPLTNGLVAYYSFNQCDARDDSGNGCHGVFFGDISCWCGIDDDGLLLDGRTAYIEFGGLVNKYFTTSDLTVSFYFRSEQYSVFDQSLLSKSEACNDYYTLDVLLNRQQSAVEAKVYESPNKYFPGLKPRLDSTRWIHFALVREGTRAFTYINGELRDEGFRCSGVDIGNEAMLNFGNSPCVQEGRAQRFKGVIDELRIYDRAFNEEEIRVLYHQHPVENAQQDCFT